jgi:hypothetical protein
MTDRAALVEKVARAMAERAGASYSWEWYRNQGIATAAIDLIRADVLEEAARVALRRTELQDDQEMAVGEDIAAAIRALKAARAALAEEKQ